MAHIDEVLDQAGYRDDGLPVSSGPWANAWSPAWESFPIRAIREEPVPRMAPLPWEAEDVSAAEAQKLAYWSAA